MRRLMISISGVRGVVGETLTPELCVRLGEAFGTYVNSGRVVVGRDTRTSGEMVKHAVFSGLISAGCEIIDVAVCATPTTAMMIPRLGAAGGIVISASHNEVEWNALKFFREDGVYLNDMQGRQLLDIYYQGSFRQVAWNEVREGRKDDGAVEHHVEKVLDIVDVPALRRRKFKVAVDCCNGAGIEMALRFLARTGCRVTKLYCEPDGVFPRIAEPSIEAVKELTRVVKKTNSDIGFALDPDADRVAVVSEKGRYIGEEYSLALTARYVLSHERGSVVTNVSTSRMIDDVAAEFSCPVTRVPVGEVNVSDRMIETGAVIGGEGNGGVIYPRVHASRDSLTGMALTLQYLLESGQTVSALVKEIPKYTMIKTKTECERQAILDILKEAARTAEADDVDTQDGVKLMWKDSWVHLRGSNTEPVIRIIAEAKTKKRAESLIETYRRFVSDAMSR